MASRKLSILISGASVAGPALAYWLDRADHDETEDERTRGLRQGGYAVDFRGEAHMGTLARMGVLDDLRALETGGGALRVVDGNHRPRRTDWRRGRRGADRRQGHRLGGGRRLCAGRRAARRPRRLRRRLPPL